MLRKIVSILALLCLLAVSNSAMAYNWAPNTTWHGGQGNNNWFDSANWWVSDTEPNAVPDIHMQVLIEPKGPFPQIDGDATCSYLNILPWSWTGLAGEFPEFYVDMNSGTFDCNYGISIGAWGTYDNQNDTTGIPAFRVFGGTVVQSASPGDGVLIGGGDNTNRDLLGKLYMYGGSLTTRRLELRFGEIHLYGGTLECNGDANFVFSQARPQNKINISGGTLKLAGNKTAALNALKTSGRVYSARGTIGTPVFDDINNWTTLTSTDNDMTKPWNPSPANSATNVHYRLINEGNDVNVGVTLGWNSGDVNVINTAVYFGTNANIVNSVYGDSNYMGEVNEANVAVLPDGEPNTFNINFNFKLNTVYYWRVDSNSIVSYTYDEFGQITGANTSVVKGRVWTFTTHNGMAYNPNPISGATALSEPFALSWTAGDFAASTMGHKVYFATGSNLLNATLRKTWTTADSRYRGLQSGTSYSLAKLAGAFTLVPGSTYYWCVDEVNGTGLWQGPIWSFTAADYVTVDDFEDYNTSAEVQANWDTAYDSTCYYPVGNGSVALVRDTIGKHMSYHYSNLSGQESSFTEIRRSYNPGTSFTGNGVLVPAPAALRVDYLGSPINGVDPDYDRMYVALQDTAGNIGIVMNPDGNAATVEAWTSWFVSLRDFNTAPNPTALKLTDVNAFMLGFGIRCDYGTVGGDGNMMFDNIRLYAQTCNPAFGPAADFDADCDVDVNDLDQFANYWLQQAELRTFASWTAPAAPVLWYAFDDSGQTVDVIDSSGNGYTGTVQRWVKNNWDPTGSRTGGACLYIPALKPLADQSYVLADVNALDFMGDAAHTTPVSVPGYEGPDGGGVSFTMWAKASLIGDFLAQWPGIFGIWNADNSGEQVEVPCPSRIGPGGSGDTLGQVGFYEHAPRTGTTGTYRPILDFGGRWNHWAFVKSASNANGPYGSLKIYCNGQMVASQDANGQPGDPNVGANGPLFALPVGSFRIGTRGDNWAMWSGRLDDFKVYDYALSDAELAYLASDGDGELLISLDIKANLVTTGAPEAQVVNFADLAEMCTEWRTLVLWP